MSLDGSCAYVIYCGFHEDRFLSLRLPSTVELHYFLPTNISDAKRHEDVIISEAGTSGGCRRYGHRITVSISLGTDMGHSHGGQSRAVFIGEEAASRMFPTPRIPGWAGVSSEPSADLH
jgi:hypothetical protein